MYLCDECICKLIDISLMKPLHETWGPGEAPWKEDNCEGCGKLVNISASPEFTGEQLKKAGITLKKWPF